MIPANPLAQKSGSHRIHTIPGIIFMTGTAVVGAFLIAKGGIVMGALLVMMPFILTFLYVLFQDQKFGIYSVIVLSFAVMGISRYIKNVPFGLAIDGVLIMCYLGMFFKEFQNKIKWKRAGSELTLLAAIWFGYALFQLVNPEALSKVAWFYAMRGVALYMFLIIPLVLILFDDLSQLKKIIYIFGTISILGTLKAAQQIYLGPDPFEKAWLDGGGSLTHVLFGKLRAFSFYSDAGQFGASQAHAGVLGTILFFNSKSTKEKIFFATMAIFGFWGMLLSGTRGAIAVPMAGLFIYLFLTKNIRVLSVGIVMMLMAFIFFKYTMIGNNVDQIRRMRTAFDPNDASLQVRLENQRRLKVYMATRPFGGGIGAAGNWGQRFSPNGFLANVPTDSWYVMIWAEQGIIGLTLHLIILFYIIGKSSFLIMFVLKDPETKSYMMALTSGMLGIMAASYGNGVLGQNPTGPLIYTSMAFLFLSTKIDPVLKAEKLQPKIIKNTKIIL